MRKTYGPAPAAFLLIIAATWLAFFALRLLAPSQLMDDDQERPSSYALDSAVNGHWIVQTDDSGDITSKPPLNTWLIAAGMKALGNGSLLALALPSGLSVLACALIILFAGQRFFGGAAGFFGASAYLLSMTGVRQLLLIRTDPLFSFTVTGMLILCLYAAMGRVSWLWFWLAAGLSSLTKGPLGLLLMLGVVPVIGFELIAKRRGKESVATTPDFTENMAGVGVFLLIAGGWFLAAYISAGHALIDKMIGQELVGHAIESSKGERIGGGLWKPALYFLTRFAPWSLLIAPVAWRFVRKPAASSEERFAERIFGAFFLFGLIIFSLSPHQRADHLYPLLPAFALLAGRVLADWIPTPGRRFFRLYVIGVVFIFCAFAAYYFIVRPYDEAVQRSIFAEEFARELKKERPGDFPYIFADVPYAVQFNLGVMRLEAKKKDAARILDGPHPAFVITSDEDKLRDSCGDPERLRIVTSWPPKDADGIHYSSHPYLPFTKKKTDAFLFLVTNQPAESQDASLATRMGPLQVVANRARIDSMKDDSIAFTVLEDYGAVEFLNDGDRPARIRVEMKRGDAVHVFRRTIAPGERWIADELATR
ncbi:hypothetical protein BH09SUM1_BH09SUM1_13070 [soil metagenome]